MADCCTTNDTPARVVRWVFHLHGDIVTEGQVRTRVGKATTAPEPVCFCFGRTLKSIPAARPEPILPEAATTSR